MPTLVFCGFRPLVLHRAIDLAADFGNNNITRVVLINDLCPLHVWWHRPCRGCAMDRATDCYDIIPIPLLRIQIPLSKSFKIQIVCACFMWCSMECATSAPWIVPWSVVTDRTLLHVFVKKSMCLLGYYARPLLDCYTYD